MFEDVVDLIIRSLALELVDTSGCAKESGIAPLLRDQDLYVASNIVNFPNRDDSSADLSDTCRLIIAAITNHVATIGCLAQPTGIERRLKDQLGL